MAAARIPTVMMFSESLHGISHNQSEDTKEEHLAQAVIAFDALAEKTMEWILNGSPHPPSGERFQESSRLHHLHRELRLELPFRDCNGVGK